MTAFKRFVLTSLSLAVLASSASVHARAGSSSSSRSSSSSSSMSSSRSAAPAPRPAPAAAPAPAPQRASIGGMQRSDVMSQARAQQAQPQPVQQAAKAPSPSPAPAYAPAAGTAAAMAAAPAKPSAPFWSSGRSSNNGSSSNSSSSWSARQEAERREAQRREDDRLAAERRAERRGGLTTGQALGAAAAVGVGAYMLGSHSSAQAAQGGPIQPTPAQTAVNGAATSVQTPGLSNKEGLSERNGGAWPVSSGDSAQNSALRSDLSGAVAPAPVSEGSGLGSILLRLLALLALVGVGVLAYRRFTQSAQPAGRKVNTGFSSSAPASGNDGLFRASAADTQAPSQAVLLEQAPKLFRAVQEANNAGDKDALEKMCDEAYLPVLTDDIDNRAEPSRTHVMSVQMVGDRVLGYERAGYRYIGSVHFRARISEGSDPVEEVQEVWHFVCNAEGADFSHYGGWKLAGIEAV